MTHLPPAAPLELVELLGPFVARQGWARHTLEVEPVRSVPVALVDAEVILSGRPGLVSIVVDAGDRPRRRLHLLVGWRQVTDATEVLSSAGALIGPATADGEEVLCYDALADQELCLELLAAVTGGAEKAGRARLVHSLVSHSSIIYDERLFMKCYRVIEPRTRPEIEMTTGLDRVGFNHLLAPVARWSRSGRDLGVVREYLPGALEGKSLALTSLRDLLGRATPDEDPPGFERIGIAGGDLGDEMRRLGQTTAELHLALATAFGVTESAKPPGAEIRVHGDYHLRRVMRADSGWLVAGFGDDPLIGREAGAGSQGEPHRASPLEDLADLFVSMRQVADEALSVQPPSTLRHARVLAAGWVQHNRAAFLRGYLETAGIERLVPSSQAEVDSFLDEEVGRRGAISTGSPHAPRSSPTPPAGPQPPSQARSR